MITFKTPFGETSAVTTSLGVYYWYMLTVKKSNENVFDANELMRISNINTYLPYHPMFLVSVIGLIEREYGKSPNIAKDLLNSDWYSDIKLEDHKDVLQAIKDSNKKVRQYEEACVEILVWLRNYGNITELMAVGS